MNLPDPLIASNDRQLFVDNHLIDSIEHVRIHQHTPIPRETCLTFNRPWEGETSWCPVVIKDGDKYRMWYRSQDEQQDTGGFNHTFTAYAESEDGICWQRPNLGLFDFNGSTDNNICVDNPNTKNIAVFKDKRPGVPESERYKAADAGAVASPLGSTVSSHPMAFTGKTQEMGHLSSPLKTIPILTVQSVLFGMCVRGVMSCTRVAGFPMAMNRECAPFE